MTTSCLHNSRSMTTLTNHLVGGDPGRGSYTEASKQRRRPSRHRLRQWIDFRPPTTHVLMEPPRENECVRVVRGVDQDSRRTAFAKPAGGDVGPRLPAGGGLLGVLA